MKRKETLILAAAGLLALTTALAGCSREAEPEDIAVQIDTVVFTYSELKEEAAIIAHIEVTDELSEENSFQVNDFETGTAGGFYGKRTAKVVEYFKDETGKNAPEISFIEPAALIDGQYLHFDGYDSLTKGEEYVVFLDDETASGDMSVMSGSNGVVRLDGENTQFPEIAKKTMAEFIDKEKPAGQDYFNGRVIELKDGGVLVRCLDVTSGEVLEGDEVEVSLDVVAARGAPKLAAGDEIRVVCTGVHRHGQEIVRLDTVFAIYMLDKDGEPIPN